MEKRNLSLDGLRGIAALLVVLAHTHFPGVLLGQLGVSIFFLLSGYLMSYLHINLIANAINLKKYAINRFSRIAPIYLIVVLYSVVAYHYDKSFVNQISGITEILRHLFFIGSKGVLWSISPEVQFYFFFAAIWIAYREYITKNSKYIYILGVLAIFFYLTRAYWPGLLLPSKLHLFLLGVLAGLASKQIVDSIDFIKSSFYEFIIILLIISRMFFIPNIELFYIDTYIAILIFTLVIVIAKGHGMISKVLRLNVFVLMGKVSFSIYLLHSIVIYYSHKFAICTNCEEGNILLNSVILIMCLILPAIISIFVELPISSYVKKNLYQTFINNRYVEIK